MIQKTTYSGTMCTVSGKNECLCALAVVFGSTHVAGAIVEKLLPLRVSRKCTGRCSGRSPRSVGGWHRKTGVWELWIASAVVVWSAVPSPPPNVVSLFDELVQPFLSSFRSMLSFFHSSLALFSLNMPSLVFPALHSLSHGADQFRFVDRVRRVASCFAASFGVGGGASCGGRPACDVCIGAVSVCVGVGWRQTVGAVETAAHQLDLHGVHFAGESATDFAAHVLRSGPLCCPHSPHPPFLSDFRNPRTQPLCLLIGLGQAVLDECCSFGRRSYNCSD
ncbi:hypothetical protein BLNAU_1648 [Blattamonas nauphoetae]|uniref:Uncharacterized protein n=1 Tax=Blattamonas nauphoetae TaxID=2049346 RepID=A0ABQ9YH70_9EUKA|nr:hypothetical protein BLNAU_1648 [Blattamonas nauphoetae]